MKLLLVNGPNLNMLGVREPEKYGADGLDSITALVKEYAAGQGYKLEAFQSNIEGEIVSFIQSAGMNAAGMILNAGAYTHTSIAIRDAILAVNLKFVEVHLTNVYKREEFRHKSYLSDIAAGVIAGFGADSYLLGIRALINILDKERH
ncbi:MAG: type II 3-dehydroquinate dehydratase [Spirochaetes bacterium GWF1_51_8]|nr:MAG: type II 3-dehydroquinate dehydratase [Spirochaetes bacterium GWF1_51_8]